MAGPLHVVATAGHVDHGKSSLIVRLTGIDPDRWEEEKRRGLTIDLGFAWCTLPSGQEVGFVDVPGHERFVRNMLAGVGPVRLVLFVVAADEGWKPQSEEHLAIVDVLGAQAGVVALTKRDLVDEETFELAAEELSDRLAGTVLSTAPVVPCSSATGEGIEDLRQALDAMVTAIGPPEDKGRPRIHVDRSFTIRGAGTVVTGTLAGGTLQIGDEARLYPGPTVARIRSLQTHRRPVEVARPVSRVAANLASVQKAQAERGDVLGLVGQWRPTDLLEVRIRAIRGLAHRLTARGAYKLYVGSAERDARVRLYDTAELHAGQEALARLRLTRPVVAEWSDRFVLREAGRRETVAGGVILDPDPPARPGPDPASRLKARETASREELPSILVAERGAVRVSDLPVLTGTAAAAIPDATRVGAWWVSERAMGDLRAAVLGALDRYHLEQPLRPGLGTGELVRTLSALEGPIASPLDQGLASELIAHLESRGELVREGTVIRLARHRVTLGGREEDAARLVGTVSDGEPTPPSVRELAAAGFGRDLIEAAVATGRLARVSEDLVVTPAFLSRAEEVAVGEAAEPAGLTVSRFRELLGTSRKYALPLLASFDERGLTRRDGDVRRPGPSA
jgi:selenocysteine-specific elongation factor